MPSSYEALQIWWSQPSLSFFWHIGLFTRKSVSWWAWWTEILKCICLDWNGKVLLIFLYILAIISYPSYWWVATVSCTYLALEQFIQAVKLQNNFWNKMFYLLITRVFWLPALLQSYTSLFVSCPFVLSFVSFVNYTLSLFAQFLFVQCSIGQLVLPQIQLRSAELS